MVPTLRDGDVLLVRHGAPVRPGDVVAAHRPDRPGTIMVKRVVRRAGAGWWLASDNPYGGTDSATFGPVPDGLVIARVVLRRDARRRRPLGWGRVPPPPPADLGA
jgi:phage repressor protein C with HTH and peptisase S24 domain